MSPTLQKILNALEKADSIPAKEKERLRKELEKTEKTLQKKDTQLSAQARELEIETALERIRARSMAMHSSEELNDVLRVMFQQIEVLGIDAKCAHLTLMDLENNTFSFRITGKNGAANMGEQIIDLNAMPIWKETVAKWKKAKAHSHQCLVYAPEILPDLWKLIDTSLKSLPAKERIKISDFPNGLFDCEGHHKFGYIGFNNSRPPTEEEISIAIRFAREFETVYQRFLDIKKAEAQTREAQIQLSLERVRARSMAMHSSEELNDVLSILFQQFDVLGIKPLNVWLSLYNLEENTFTYRATGTGGSRVQGQQVIDLAAMDIWQEQLEQWKSGNAEPVLVTFYPPEVLPQLMEVFKETFDAMPAEERMDPKLFPDGGYNVQGYTKFGYIGYNHLQAPTQEEKDILLKFATEFERVYQRFMEIKKAEGQAREAQIEAALERVRAASMAMHKTGEISEVVTVLFDQLNHLNVPFLQIWITILNLDKDYFDIWFSPLEGVYETTQYFTMPSMYFEDTAIKTWRSKAPFSYRSLKSVAEVDEFINACDAITGSTYFSHGRKIKNYNQLEFIEARHEYGFISKSNTEPPTETEANILQRFAKVFEQAYTRFLDIEKAEAQARESQIEAALEKVRSQSLAMHSTGEMQLVANAVFEQLQALGLEMDVVGMSGVIGHKQDYEVWIGGAPLGSALRIPYNEDTQVQRDYNKMLRDRPELFVRTYSGKVKKEYIDRLLTHGEFPKALKKKMETSSAFTTLIAPKKNSGIQVVRYTDQPFTDQDAEILKRFAGVFEQAYIRFMDLEKAEAQAREAQIEASLERIRAKAMAMHVSSELNEVLSVLFEQFNTLGINPVWAHLSLIDLEENTFTYRMSRADKNNRLSGQVVDLDARPEWQDAVKAFKSSKPNSVSCLEFPKEVLPQIWELFEESFSSISEEYPVKMEDFPNGIYNTQGYCKFGYIGFNHNRPPTEEEKEIVVRIANEFGRVYQRFLDLQKAEAQAREAQIEAALERVRARTMAMHNTEDIGVAVTTFFNELMGLHPDHSLRCGIGILSQAEHMQLWTASVKKNSETVLHSGTLDMSLHPLLSGVKKAWSNRDKTFSYVLKGQDRKTYFGILNKAPDYPVKFDLNALPETVYHNSFAFRDGMLFAFTEAPLQDDIRSVLERFSSVFGQTYTRYLDLQKAEAQAREAQIEAALERVRARSMAMHSTDEMQLVANAVFEQLEALGIEMDVVGMSGVIEDKQDYDVWIGGAPLGTALRIPYNEDTQVQRDYNKMLKDRPELFVRTYSGQVKKEYIDRLLTHGEFPKALKKKMETSDAFTTLIAPKKNSGIQVVRYTDQPFTDQDAEILKRFAGVFEQAYIRFMDLEKAEAQAREAQIETALEKVRSQSLAMHNSEEIAKVAAAMFNQLTNIGINDLRRCVIYTFNQAQTKLQCWYTTEDGKSYAHHFSMPLKGSKVMHEIVRCWKSGKPMSMEVSGSLYDEWGAFIRKHGWQYPKGEKPAKLMFLNEFPFKYGLFEVATYSELMKEGHVISARFTQVFEQVYTRFLDLQKAEAQAREAEIETALEKVRTASMTMQQSEDLAKVIGVVFKQLKSLGVQSDGCGLSLFDHEDGIEMWISGFGEEVHPQNYHLAYFDHPYYNQQLNDWKNQRIYSELIFEGELKKSYDEHTFSNEDFFKIPVNNRKDFLESEFKISCVAYMKYGMLEVVGNEGLPNDQADLLCRFAKVFEQTYTRFLDLQRAEAQAREAQIEGALERVRSKTMAMHNSEDLEDIVISLFDEVMNLGLDQSIRCGIGILEGHEGMETRSVNKSFDGTVKLKTGMLDMTIHPMLVGLKKAWKNKSAEYSYDYTAKDVRKYYEVLNNEPEYPFNADLETLPEQEFHRSFFFSSGIIFAFSKNPISEESSKILARFATVFGQTYQRFIDLQKAEERAKDAVKQASLDRVRGQIASMRSAEDLERITPLVWNELTILGIPFIRCGVFIIEESNQTVQAFLSAPDGRSLGAMQIPFDAEKNTAETVAHWQKGEVYRTHWDKRQFLQFMQNMIDLGQINNNKEYQGAEEPPESLHLHFVPFTQGMLYVGSEATLTEDQIELVQSLADAFAIAYARYEDFSNLEKAKERVETTLSELKATQNQLVQSEKMASLGELTAGIAHEIQNPLNFVNNFSEVSIELIEEMLEEIQKGDVEEVKALAEDIIQNLEKINHHGKRADGIVKGMLQHSRASSGEKEATDINVLADEYLRLAYHGLRAKDKSFNATLETHFDKSIGKVNVIPQDMGRVILNLITNAFYAVKEKSSFAKASEDDTYEPTVSVITKKLTPPSGAGGVEIRVKDNGNGIPKKVLDKIFQPFFTTKPTGQGTGLGLSMSYDIITKGHGGDLKVDTKEGRGSTFTISIPVS